MSRVGKKPIEIPKKTEVTISGQDVKVEGPKGVLEATVHPWVTPEVQEIEGEEFLTVSIDDEENVEKKAQWGTARSVLSNMVKGASEGFSKELEINGVGYEARVQGSTLVLSVGYSHDVNFDLPDGIKASVEGNKITIEGPDKQLVGQTASQIRAVRKPEPYKGKGIKYADEVIRRKVGKAAQAATEA